MSASKTNKNKSGKIIGLTGGIAAGKSTVAKILAENGATVIDLDLFGHRVYEPGKEGYTQVLKAFGSGILAQNGRIDRKALGALVFPSAVEMKKLTSITWPLIRKLARVEIQKIRERDADVLIVVEGAVIVEAAWLDVFDELWVVTASDAVVLERIMRRNGLSLEAAKERLASQTSKEERAKHADRIIENNGDEDALRKVLGLR